MGKWCYIMCVCIYLSIYIYVYTYIYMHIYSHIFFVHSSFDGHLGWLYIFAIINHAAMNIGGDISFWMSVIIFFECIPNNGIAE